MSIVEKRRADKATRSACDNVAKSQEITGDSGLEIMTEGSSQLNKALF
jgi:hypothetical protein